MASLIKISEAASLAMHAMVFLAANEARPHTSKEMAGTLGVSEFHLAKVMQRLGRMGLVGSQRGPRGGFTLGRPAAGISLLEVYEATEGPFDQKECLLENQVCTGYCIMGTLLHKIGNEVSHYLRNTMLSSLVGVYPKELSCNG